jgi:PHP family Zn ribbon phosphoesterase
MPNYQPSHSYERFNVPRHYRILCDSSSYEELMFATMDQPVESPKGLVPTTSMYHKQACYSHNVQLCLSEQIAA